MIVGMGEEHWSGKNMEVHPGQQIENLILKVVSYKKSSYASPGCNKVTDTDVESLIMGVRCMYVATHSSMLDMTLNEWNEIRKNKQNISVAILFKHLCH